jgi:hypothetical protein
MKLRDMERRHAFARALGALTLAGAAAVAIGGCGEDDRPASWSYIHTAIIAPNCATSSCHSESTAQAGVRLHSVEAAYTILVGRACESNDPPGSAVGNFVRPGQPDRSQLMYLLEGVEVKRQMPPDRPLPDRDIGLVERWILEGAPCN